MDFTLFLLVNIVLLIRPAEIVPALENLPIYNGLILACLIVAHAKVLKELTTHNLVENPISMCVVGLLVAVVLSHLSHLNLSAAKDGAVEFGKVLLYYLLLVSVLDSPGRLRRFLCVLALCTVILSTLALLQYHGMIDVESLRPVFDGEVDDATGGDLSVVRLCGMGIYHDPNDLCLVLLISMGISLYGLGDRKHKLARILWLLPFFLFAYALTRTHSKGGFLAMIAAMGALFLTRYGWRKSVPLLLITLPVLFIVFAGRQTKISTSSDTGQDRIQLWSAGLALFRQFPVFGIGQHRYADEAGLVAHNSYIHGFTELGFFGGTLFAGSFYYALATLHGLGRWQSFIPDPELRRLRPFLLAMVSAYAVCLLTISRNYIVPTYMLLGLVTVYLRQVSNASPIRPFPVDSRLIRRFGLCGVGILLVGYVFIRTFARFGGG